MSSCAPLECISFYDCPSLKKIYKDSMPKEIIIEIKADKSWWNELEWEDTKCICFLKTISWLCVKMICRNNYQL
ncbi:hypothetical protein Pint_24416 [Pistacia integerrima]|uniref:Uncharacterized protein n=1 Tax=Pistacia integerrima TaxID=434235 RepID=A0ACC0YIK9_9ROSI|nr:hypothetical protein Pint_24416 [Pistacia integerrima]